MCMFEFYIGMYMYTWMFVLKKFHRNCYVFGQHAIPPIPPDCPEVLSHLMHQCWSRNPSKRPDFTEIVHVLKAMDRDIQLAEASKERPDDRMTNLNMQLHVFSKSGFTKEYTFDEFLFCSVNAFNDDDIVQSGHEIIKHLAPPFIFSSMGAT